MVSALDEAWRVALVHVAKERAFATLDDVPRVAPLLAKLSAAYNHGKPALARDLLPARLAFSFPRDVPKAEGAVRELVATGALALPEDRPLRLLDIGAGLGAMTVGIARALGANAGRIDATWIDSDTAALDVGRAILAQAPLGRVEVSARVHGVDAHAAQKQSGVFDVIVCGQVLSEMDAALDPAARVTKHAEWLRALVHDRLAPEGSLVIVEPALIDRTRHLHAVRDALFVEAGAEISLFAPCLHRAACPALASPGDWCHEDLAIDLPAWLVPLARGAGLRWQGLTFSYLVLRKDARTLARETGAKLRVVSDRLVTKGKVEAFLCGAFAGGVARQKVQRLDRDERALKTPFADLARGDILTIDPTPDKKIGVDMQVNRTRYT